jgi:hypothetical protein
MLDAIIEPISDLSTVAAQSMVEWIADHSSLARDGWALAAVRIVVAAFVFLAIAVGVPVLLIGVLWWLAMTLLF